MVLFIFKDSKNGIRVKDYACEKWDLVLNIIASNIDAVYNCTTISLVHIDLI